VGRLPRYSIGLAVALAVTVWPGPAAAGIGGNVATDADWILRAQLPDGSIAQYVDRQAVVPYVGNYAALGLARATSQTGRSVYAEAAWKWLTWYVSHQGAEGFVQDYAMVNGSLHPTGDMDSTDAYAGTFLIAARATWNVDPTRTLGRLARLKPGIAKAVGAIEATMDSDGLTWAKPSWHVKYAMDQSEVFAGLRAAGEMSLALGDSALARRALIDAGRVRAGFAALWNPQSQAYDWALHENGERHPTDWSILYPDALEQVWTVAFGLADPSRAPGLMSHFAVAQPMWDEPTATATFSLNDRASPGTVGYWPVAGLAFYATGDASTATLASDRIRAAALSAGRAWPFSTGTAGGLIVLETGGLEPLSVARSSQLGGGLSAVRRLV
jgi:hypothetical protein